MGEAIQHFLRKTFDLREGEVWRASLMLLNIFLIITTLLIVKPTVTGLFLSEIGVEQLPKVFILVSIFAAVISSFYARLIGRMALDRLIVLTLSISVVLFLGFGVLLRMNVVGGWILYAFYIWVAIFGVLSASQFWILANVVFNIREAKRLFGFIGTGAIAGGIFGGYLTNILAEPLGSENLIFVGAILLFFCIPITIYIWKKQVIHVQTRFQRKKKIGKRDHAFHLIKKSSHLTYLAGIVGISVIIAKLVDYQFNAVASAKISDPDELTAFLGLWFSNFNLLSLIIQLLFTRKIVGTLGVGTSLLFLPMSILSGAILLFFVPELWVAIALKMSDGSLKQSVNKAAVELLALPIPLETKTQTKTFIDVFVDSVATGIGGIILIFFVKGLDLPVSFISIIISVLIGLWIFFVMRVRKEYLKSFRLKMTPGRVPPDEVQKLEDQKSILEGWKKVLVAGTEKQILYALKKLKEKPDDRLFDELYPLIHHSSEWVRSEALQVLYYLHKANINAEVEALVKDPSQKVKVAAFEYLIEHEPDRIEEFMGSFLQEADYKVQSAALVSLAVESRDNPKLRELFNLEERLNQEYAKISEMEEGNKQDLLKIGFLKALGAAKIPKFFPLLEVFFQDARKKIAHQALLSAGDTLHPYFVPALVGFLENEKKRTAAQAALVTYGQEIVPTLLRYIKDPQTPTEVIRALPEVMEKFGNQQTVGILFDLLKEGDYSMRLATLKSLNTMKSVFPFLNFNDRKTLQFILEEAKVYQGILGVLYAQIKKQPRLKKPKDEFNNTDLFRSDLIQLLEKRLDNNLERIFRLLGLKYPPEDIIPIYEHIQSEKGDLRVNAIEYLDNLLEPNLKRILIPIIETALLDTISEEAISNLNLKIPDELKGFEVLMQTKDVQLKLAILHLIKGQPGQTYRTLLRSSAEDPHPKVRKLALEILNKQ